ncbi:MAG: NAD(+) diphosphatase [Paracoccaceae bacterium]|nr:NAD(+) diphosphatase [Paracoccaceae bacterium]
MRGAEQVTFGGSGLDRAAALRARLDEIAYLMAAPAARLIPVWRGKPLFAGEAGGWIALGHEVQAEAIEPPIFLGLDEGEPRFACDISVWEPEEEPETLGAFFDPSEQRHPGLPPDHRFAELRGVMTQLSAREAELVATAKALTGWHAAHAFCARCGQRSVPAQAGWQRDCPACGARHFPRTDPVVIMLITHGDAVLVGRSSYWPEGMYSLLAGFVEPGETLEAAVRREAFEETGVSVGAVSYLASQPWPFPASLMIGCSAEAMARDITLDPEELEDALWLTRAEALDALSGTHPKVKAARRGSIARFLLERWLADRMD